MFDEFGFPMCPVRAFSPVGGRMRLYKKDGPAPDPLIGQAAAANAKLGQDVLEYYKNQDAAAAPYRDEAYQISLDQARQQVESSQKQEARADEAAGFAQESRAADRKLLSDALAYDTPARREAEAAQAIADVGTQADAARGTLMREAATRGVDVNSGNFTNSLAGMSMGEAAVKAASGNAARKSVEQIGAAKLADAAAAGKGVVANSATQAQIALQAGNSAVGNASNPVTLGNASTGVMGQGFNSAVGANASAGNLALGQYNAQVKAADNSDMFGALGKLGGAAIFKFSDKNMKEGRKKVAGRVALDQVKRLPDAETYRYKRGSPADDGGKRHVGHMAQDVHAAMGEEAAPSGKVVNLERLATIGLAAVKQLDKQQKRAERRLVRLENAKTKAV